MRTTLLFCIAAILSGCSGTGSSGSSTSAESLRVANLSAKTSDVTLRANATGDTVWVKATYGLSGSFAATDSVVVNFYRPGVSSDTGTAAAGHTTRATSDSAYIPSLVAAGGTQTFSVCTHVKSANGMTSPSKCSAIVSWTRPAPVVVVIPGTPTVSFTTRATATQLWVIGTFGYTGTVTSVNTTAGFNSGGTAQNHTFSSAVSTDSFAFTLPAPGTGTTAGYGGAKACNSAGCSTTQFNSWSYTAPPDTTSTPAATVIGLILWPDSLSVKAGTSPRSFTYKVVNGKTVAYSDTGGQTQFCAFTKMSNNQIWPTSNSKGIARCDSVGATMANYNPTAATRVLPRDFRYAVAHIPVSIGK